MAETPQAAPTATTQEPAAPAVEATPTERAIDAAKAVAKAALPPAEPVQDVKDAPAEAKPVEPAKDAPKPEEAKPKISRELSAIAARERRARDLEQRARPLAERAQAYEKAVAERDIEAILRHHGLTWDDVARQAVTGKPPEPKPEDRIAQLEKWKQDREQAEAQRQLELTRAQKQQVLDNFQAEIGAFIESSKTYPLVQSNGAADMVYRVIDQHYQDTGEILDTADAAQHVEDQLREFISKGYQLISPTTTTVSSEKPQPGKDTTVIGEKTPKPISTLTNNLSAAPSSQVDPWDLTPEERMERAVRRVQALSQT